MELVFLSSQKEKSTLINRHQFKFTIIIAIHNNGRIYFPLIYSIFILSLYFVGSYIPLYFGKLLFLFVIIRLKFKSDFI